MVKRISNDDFTLGIETFEVVTEKAPNLDEKPNFALEITRAQDVIENHNPVAVTRSPNVSRKPPEMRTFINSQLYEDLKAPASEWGEMEIKGTVERRNSRFFPRIAFIPGQLCYGASCLLEELLQRKDQTLEQKCTGVWKSKSNNDGYLCRQTDCMMRLITIYHVTRFGDRHFTWKEWENQADEEEELDIFN